MYDMYGKCLFVHPVTYDMYGLSIRAVHSVHRGSVGNPRFSGFTDRGLRKVVFVHLVSHLFLRGPALPHFPRPMTMYHVLDT
jgi:hypothetical protein